MNNTLDVRQLIDQQPIGRYQKWVVFLGFLIIALDGWMWPSSASLPPN